MNTSEILRSLPDSVQWMVMFRLAAIRPWSSEDQMKAMFYLSDATDLRNFSHVILTSQGRYLAPLDDAGGLGLDVETSLFERFPAFWKLFPPDEADCLGLGEKPGMPPVLLHLTMDGDGWGHARALFHREPSRRHYEMLKAVGVRYEGGYPTEGGYVGLFRNRLATHLHAGALAHYSRTGNCNALFLNHGEIDSELLAGLSAAAEARTAAGVRRARAAAAELGKQASRACLAMTCHPPAPDQPFGYGDLVPLGFLLRALNSTPAAAAPVRDRLLAARQGKLWSFHTGRLVTATDSVLILQALPEREAVEELEVFGDGQGGYYPQLWSATRKAGHMVIQDANAHWCQPDFATTCLVRAMRAETGLCCRTPLRYLEDRFETRSGLYFANPYLTDWALAKAIAKDDQATGLKRRLTKEILASRNEDWSFGGFDMALSTGLAILALASLGCRGRALRLAQLRLLEMMEGQSGLWPECTPFYSSFSAPGAAPRHEVSWYTDTHRMIVTSVAAMALDEPCDALQEESGRAEPGVVHPRYRTRDQRDYVLNFALRPYEGKLEDQMVSI